MQLVEPGDENRPTLELAPRKEDNRRIQRQEEENDSKRESERELERVSEDERRNFCIIF